MYTNVVFSWTAYTATTAELGFTISSPVAGVTYCDSTMLLSSDTTFFYTIPSTVFDFDSTANDLDIEIHTIHNGNTTATAIFNTVSVIDQDTAQEQIITNHGVIIKLGDDRMDTSHSVFIDVDEVYGASSVIFWTDHDGTEVLPSIVSPEFSYDKEPYNTKALLDSSSEGLFKLLRRTDADTKGIKGQVHFLLGSSENSLTDLDIFIRQDNDADTTGTAIDNIKYDYFSSETPTHLYTTIPDDLMREFSENDFNGVTVQLHYYAPTQDSTIFVFDSYITMISAYDDSLTTNHSAAVAAAGTPYVWKSVVTNHSARIKRGPVVVFDYYTPGTFWDLGSPTKYTVSEWNKLEEILQDIGRFFHSPILYNAQVPCVNDMELIFGSGGNITFGTSYSDSSGAYAAVTDSSTYKGIAIIPSVGEYLTLYNPSISPNMFLDDGTFWRITTYAEDCTVYLQYYVSTGTDFTAWYNVNNEHPFVSDHTFKFVVYGKKG